MLVSRGVVGGFKYFVSFPRNMVKRLPRSKTSILFRLRWVARTPTYYDKHQLHLCQVLFCCFFDTGCIGNKGDSQIPKMKNNSELPSGQWHCWPFDVHAPRAA